MFKWIGGLLDRVCAVAGALVFSQAPLFIQQYKQQLSGHVSELQLQVEVMRQTAMQSGKTLEQFIKKFIDNSDPDFSRQGEIMKTMVDRWHQLSDGFTALNSASILTKPFAFMTHFNLSIAKEAAHSYTLGIPLNLEGLVYAIAGIGFGYMAYHSINTFLTSFFKAISGKKNMKAES